MTTIYRTITSEQLNDNPAQNEYKFPGVVTPGEYVYSESKNLFAPYDQNCQECNRFANVFEDFATMPLCKLHTK
jgi:hypothetical protein